MDKARILLGKSVDGLPQYLLAEMANRHGLVAGATGTGKTVSLQLLAESFSALGVPVFTADVKGDLSGISAPGALSEKLKSRLETLKLEVPHFQASPTLFWDVFGERGHPVRATISEMGPLVLSRLLELNETQEGILHIAFRYADDQGLLLLDLKDLKALLQALGEQAESIRQEYGNVSSTSIGAIQRRLLVLEESGGINFFGEPAVNIAHLMQKDFSGRGVVSVLQAAKLIEMPRAYAMFLLWLLSELFENLDEVGDEPLPRLIFFFDEAHLLFNGTPKALVEKICQVIRLVRSKGVGIFFVTQNPRDIPRDVLGQLGNRIQHALRAFTPLDEKQVRAAAQTFRENPKINTEEVITQLGVGEALVSVLDERGQPTPVEHVIMCPPQSRIGTLSDEESQAIRNRSPLRGVYEKTLDRESAFEVLSSKRKLQEAAEPAKIEPKSSRMGPAEAFLTSLARSVGTQVGRQILRGILGSLTGARKR